MSNRGAWAEINLSALRHNISAIKSRVADGAKFCAVVKADAYGHGAVAVAREAVAQGADYLAVAVLSEAVKLREAGFTTPILILGPTQPQEADVVVRYRITQAVFTVEQAAALAAAALRQHTHAKVHLAVDTGMGRIGVRPGNAGAVAAAIAGLPGIWLEGMFSHFASADSKDKMYAAEQFRRFQEAVAAVEARGIKLELRHIANSAAILEMPETHLDMVRAGIILYGLWPSDEVEHVIDLRPVMKVKARLSCVKDYHPGETVSYGRTFMASREMRVGTLPVGYADGYTRLYAGKAVVEINGQRVPVVGRICMDQCMVDVTDVNGARVGDEAVLFGSPTLTADEAAGWLGTINYEVVCMISPRVPRVYVEDK
ncbi:alanine racemase [Schwartzia succinivorans]|jgi:alanine racemase|uniref:Alanine racemase n=1 Tax=Schwartzia succinivorans DSM 10502 TaxID=1123243 RepID=A0A1M5A6Q6_9FIRM|nr:alanine racemase [Schwartzia succinivorans]SHF25716.1 alanine racemase [Schwartzia succinivorans DSM 10502]